MHLVQERRAFAAVKVPGSIERRRTPLIVGIAAALVVVLLDQVSKTWVLRSIAVDGERHLIGRLRLIRRYNTGVAFSVGNGSRVTAWITTTLMVVLVGWVVHTLRGTNANANASRETRNAPSIVRALALGCIAGGAFGNQIDRFFRGARWNRGAVIDFVDVGFWPVFNVADAALSCGCVAVALLSLRKPKPDRSTKR